MGNRKAAETVILKVIQEIDPSGYNTEKYKEIFKEMNNTEFDSYMKAIEKGEKQLVIFVPPSNKTKITIENNLNVGKKYGVKFFHKLTVNDPVTSSVYQNPIEYMILDLPVRRQSQNLIKKTSIPPNNRSIDMTTYQPTGNSKGAKVSAPELQILNAMQLDNSLMELIKFRGGDKGGFNAYNAMMLRYGSVNLASIKPYATGVESTRTLKTYLAAMHLKATL